MNSIYPEGTLAAESMPDSETSSGLRKVEKSQTFAEIYQEHFDFVWRTVQRFGISGEGINDATQEIFLVVHRKLGDFEGRSSVRTWLYSITRRVAHNRRKSINPSLHGHRSDAELESFATNSPTPERQAELKTVLAILEQLDEEKKEVFFLAELEQHSVVEISEILEMNVNTAHARLRAARQQFAAACLRLRAKDARWAP